MMFYISTKYYQSIPKGIQVSPNMAFHLVRGDNWRRLTELHAALHLDLFHSTAINPCPAE